MRKAKKVIALSLIAVQVMTFSSPILAAQANDKQKNNENDVFIANSISSAANTIQNNNYSGLASGLISNQASYSAENFLKQYGTAKVNLQFNDHFTLKNSSLDLLAPFYMDSDKLFYTQLGIRDNDGYTTTNLGFGARHNYNDWLLGYNAFWDATWNGVNHRYGVGLEAWRDYLKISANGYRGITGWHQSKKHSDFDERPANGWDLRIEGWLPAYPQLGAKLIQEQYYGENVALFSFENKQKDPYATTIGINYTPIPIVTLGFDSKHGKGGANDSQINLSLNYQFGVALSDQLDSDFVAQRRTIAGSKLDLVERNNNIVMDYKKQDLISLQFPESIRGSEGAIYTFTPIIRSKYGAETLTINDAEIQANGGALITSSPEKVTIKLPEYSEKAYKITGVATDSRGNKSNVSFSNIYVSQLSHVLSMNIDKDKVLSNSTDSANVTALVKKSDGSPVVNEVVKFTASGGELSESEVETNASGEANIKITSKKDGNFTVTAIAGNQKTTQNIIFYSENETKLVANKTVAQSNGNDEVLFTLKATNHNKEPLRMAKVKWQTNIGVLSASETITDDNGESNVTLLSNNAGKAIVTASIDGTSNNSSVDFTDDVLSSILSVNKNTAIADGNDAVTATIVVKDKNGDPVISENIKWQTNIGVLSSSNTVTNNQGESQITLSSHDSGNAILVATVADVNYSSSIVFTEGALNTTISLNKVTATADGIDKITASVLVKDSKGNPVINENVKWKTTFGVLSSQDSVTDNNGLALVSLTSDKEGDAIIGATIDDATVYSDTITFKVLAKKLPVIAYKINDNGVTSSYFSASPKIAWKGAQLKMVMTDSVGDVTWSVNNSSVSMEGDILTFNSDPSSSSFIVSAVDKNGNTGSFTIQLGQFINYISDSVAFLGAENNTYNTAWGICDSLGSKVLTLGNYSQASSQWGFLSEHTRNGWKKAYYNTNTPYGSALTPEIKNYVFYSVDGTSRDSWGTRYQFACGRK